MTAMPIQKTRKRDRKDCPGMPDVTVLAGATSNGARASEGCTDMRRITIPDNAPLSQGTINFHDENSKIQTCRDFIEKNFKGFYKILENHKEKNESVVIVAHSSTSYALTTFVNGVPSDRKIGWTQCSNCAVIKFFVEN